ncbi:MAG: PD-(D/E)XK nuclease family protein [Cyanobacteria bacterium HKST-UBA03]|nr:PD-(D/E)XK nuclease family protein [Cyanobacteria bacterium HKST-UBA03]
MTTSSAHTGPSPWLAHWFNRLDAVLADEASRGRTVWLLARHNRHAAQLVQRLGAVPGYERVRVMTLRQLVLTLYESVCRSQGQPVLQRADNVLVDCLLEESLSRQLDGDHPLSQAVTSALSVMTGQAGPTADTGDGGTLTPVLARNCRHAVGLLTTLRPDWPWHKTEAPVVCLPIQAAWRQCHQHLASLGLTTWPAIRQQVLDGLNGVPAESIEAVFPLDTRPAALLLDELDSATAQTPYERVLFEKLSALLQIPCQALPRLHEPAASGEETPGLVTLQSVPDEAAMMDAVMALLDRWSRPEVVPFASGSTEGGEVIEVAVVVPDKAKLSVVVSMLEPFCQTAEEEAHDESLVDSLGEWLGQTLALLALLARFKQKGQSPQRPDWPEYQYNQQRNQELAEAVLGWLDLLDALDGLFSPSPVLACRDARHHVVACMEAGVEIEHLLAMAYGQPPTEAQLLSWRRDPLYWLWQWTRLSLSDMPALVTALDQTLQTCWQPVVQGQEVSIVATALAQLHAQLQRLDTWMMQSSVPAVSLPRLLGVWPDVWTQVTRRMGDGQQFETMSSDVLARRLVLSGLAGQASVSLNVTVLLPEALEGVLPDAVVVPWMTQAHWGVPDVPSLARWLDQAWVTAGQGRVLPMGWTRWQAHSLQQRFDRACLSRFETVLLAPATLAGRSVCIAPVALAAMIPCNRLPATDMGPSANVLVTPEGASGPPHPWAALPVQSADSPVFDPAQALMLSPSAIDTYTRCPRQYYYRHVLGLKTPADESVLKGLWLHWALQYWGCQTRFHLEQGHAFPDAGVWAGWLRTWLDGLVGLEADLCAMLAGLSAGQEEGGLDEKTRRLRHQLHGLTPLTLERFRTYLQGAIGDMQTAGFFDEPVSRIETEVELSAFRLPQVDHAVFGGRVDALMANAEGQWRVVDYKVYGRHKFSDKQDQTRVSKLTRAFDPHLEEAQGRPHHEVFKHEWMSQVPLYFYGAQQWVQLHGAATAIESVGLQICRPRYDGDDPAFGSLSVMVDAETLQNRLPDFAANLQRLVVAPVRQACEFSTNPMACARCDFKAICDVQSTDAMAATAAVSEDLS